VAHQRGDAGSVGEKLRSRAQHFFFFFPSSSDHLSSNGDGFFLPHTARHFRNRNEATAMRIAGFSFLPLFLSLLSLEQIGNSNWAFCILDAQRRRLMEIKDKLGLRSLSFFLFFFSFFADARGRLDQDARYQRSSRNVRRHRTTRYSLSLIPLPPPPSSPSLLPPPW